MIKSVLLKGSDLSDNELNELEDNILFLAKLEVIKSFFIGIKKHYFSINYEDIKKIVPTVTLNQMSIAIEQLIKKNKLAKSEDGKFYIPDQELIIK